MPSKRFGIAFPFSDSPDGLFLKTTKTPSEELRANFIHLILTKKGSRYFLPDFGTRLMEYVFDQLDEPTLKAIESELQDAVDKYLPNLQILGIHVTILKDANDAELNPVINSDEDARVFRVAGTSAQEHTAKIRIEYTLKDNVFQTKDFVIINI
jgi:phage baseplate assembly protein W|tara:strand:+ start:10862 stop:11323 length:462 start_codon:yes stop_codon:yes gene_type:complete